MILNVKIVYFSGNNLIKVTQGQPPNKAWFLRLPLRVSGIWVYRTFRSQRGRSALGNTNQNHTAEVLTEIQLSKHLILKTSQILFVMKV